MTLAQLVVKLSLEAKDFHRALETVSKRIERTGKQISKIGREISMAISLPLLAAGFAAFKSVLDESHRSFGPLFLAFEGLKEAAHSVFLAFGRELEPAFLNLIALARRVVEGLRNLVDWFSHLSPGIKRVIINTLLFLAALGPAIIIIGKLVTVVGALGRAFSLLLTPTGLIIAAILLLAAAAVYVITHWEWAKMQFLAFWTFLVDLFFQSIRFTLTLLDIFSLGILKVAGVTDWLRGKVDKLSDSVMGNLGAALVKAQEDYNNAKKGVQGFGNGSQTVIDILNAFAESERRARVEAEALGVRFNKDAALATRMQTAIEGLIAAGANLDTVLDKNGQTLRGMITGLVEAQMRAKAFEDAMTAFGPRVVDQLRAIARFWEIVNQLGGVSAENMRHAAEIITREGQQMIGITRGIQSAIADLATGIGEWLGNFAMGGSEEFRRRMEEISVEQEELRRQFAASEISADSFGRSMNRLAAEAKELRRVNDPLRQFAAMVLKTIGDMARAVGTAMIAFGIAGVAIRHFISNPVGAIIAGTALVALGSILSAVAQNSITAGAAALSAGGGTVGPYTTGQELNPAGDRKGNITIVFPGGPRLFDPNDPRQQDAFITFLDEILGRGMYEIRQGA